MRHQTLSHQRRAGVDTVLARIATDPTFRQQLRAAPSAALAALGQADDAAEVKGYMGSCSWTCNWTCKRTKIEK